MNHDLPLVKAATDVFRSFAPQHSSTRYRDLDLTALCQSTPDLESKVLVHVIMYMIMFTFVDVV